MRNPYYIPYLDVVVELRKGEEKHGSNIPERNVFNILEKKWF